MKKTLIIVIAVVVIGLIAFFVFWPKVVQTQPDSPNQVQSATAIVTPLSSDVSIKEAGKQNFRVIGAAASTTGGTSVRTSSRGRALIESSFSHPTAVDYSTEVVIKISDAGSKKTSLELIGGALWARTKKSVEQGDFYEIKTGNAVAVVHGTSFGITYHGTSTTIAVTDGEVSLYRRDPKTGEAIEDSKVDVDANHKGIVDEGGNPESEMFSSEDMKADWLVENQKAEIDDVPTVTATPKPKPTPTPTPTKRLDPSPTPTARTIPPVTIKPDTSVSIQSVTPNMVSAGSLVTIKGTNFKRVKEVVIGENVPPDFEVVNDSTIQFKVDKLVPGTYDIDLILDDNSDLNIPEALSIR